MDEAEVKRVRRLPPGPHGLPPELVERNQRERLIAAMAEVCGEVGYVESSVAEIAKRASVSTASFYRQFKDKRECMLISFEELFGRLLEAIEGVCPASLDPAARARVGAQTAAALLAADPPTARLLSLEILAVGPEGVRAQHAAIERIACLLGGRDKDGDAEVAGRPWAIAAAAVSLIARRVAEGGCTDAAELEALIAL